MCNIPTAISRQLRDYALACDTHDWDLFGSLFVRGKFHFASGPGAEAARQWGIDVVRPGARTQHIISNVHVEVDQSAGRAIGTNYLTLISHTDDIQVVSACYFNNEWAFEDGAWWWTNHQIVPFFRGDSNRIHVLHQPL
jgi:hypothetical protein